LIREHKLSYTVSVMLLECTVDEGLKSIVNKERVHNVNYIIRAL